MSRHLTGFDEEVQLGQLGEILENDSVVMTVELSDEDDKTIRPVDELLWRGVTMLQYEKGRWHRQSKPTQSVVSFRSDRRARARARRSARRSSSSPTTPRPCSASGRCSTRPRPTDSLPHLTTNDGTLFRPDQRGGDYEYEVISDADPTRPQPHESPPGEFDKHAPLDSPGL